MNAARPGLAAMLRWSIGLLLLVAVLALLSGEVPQLRPVGAVLDRIGFEAGKYRISILALLRLGAIAISLFMIVRMLNRLLRRVIRRTNGLDPTQRLLTEKLIGIFIVVTAFFIGVDMVGIDLTALTVFSGALGLAVGFGLQKTFGNLIAGIILLMDRSIKPGDVIVVGDSFGMVNKIGVRAVSVLTRDGKEHLIPNEILMTEEVENWSYSDRNVRVHIPVGVSYKCDIHLAQRLMIEAAIASRRVLATPKPTVWLREFGDSSVDHDIMVWIADPENGVGSVRSDVLNRVWDLFSQNGIQLPFPQRDLHLRSIDSDAAEMLRVPR